MYYHTGTNPGGKTISYGFDNRDRLVSVTDAGGLAMVYSFDDDHNGRISSITKDSQTVTYTYDDTPETGEGKFLYLTLPNGIKKETIFNEDTGRLETIRYSKDSKVLYQFDYTFDNRGNITRKITTKHDGGKITEHYNYDIINRLNSVIKEDGGVSKTAYAFDAMGNRLSKRMSGFTSSGQALDKMENYDYDACDQLTCVDGAGFEYDLNGNLAKKRDDMAGDMVYKFNYANRLREVLFADGTKAQYVYKSDGMRINRTDRTGKTTKYYRDSSNIPEALNEGGEDGNITLNLFPGTGFKSTKNGSQNSTQWRWFITDHLGSVIALTDINGIVTDEYVYDEFGNITQTKGSSYNPYRYTGQNWDETTGLLYLRARYYDSQTGRFVSRDPIGTFAHYIYTNNSPIIFNDIIGLSELVPKELQKNGKKIKLHHRKVVDTPSIGAPLAYVSEYIDLQWKIDTIELYQNINPVGATPLYFGEITASLVKFEKADPFVAWGLQFDFPEIKDSELKLFFHVSSVKERIKVFVIIEIIIIMPMTYNKMATQTRFSEYFCLNPFSA